MARKRVVEAPSLHSWEDVNDALRQIAEAQIALGEIQSDIQRMPGEWMTYYVHNSTFTDNDTVIDGPLADQVRLEDGNYVQQSA